jgi:hypothetical protein
MYAVGGVHLWMESVSRCAAEWRHISHIDAKRRPFPQNYKTLLIHPNMSKGNFSMP